MGDIKRQPTSGKEVSLMKAKVKPENSLTRADSSVPNLTSERPMFNSHLMEAVCERSNLLQALKRVEGNKGAPGIDGMTVEGLEEFLRETWPNIKAQLLSGTYKPTFPRSHLLNRRFYKWDLIKYMIFFRILFKLVTGALRLCFAASKKFVTTTHSIN